MKMSKLSNQTNSQDPQAVNSRVFVGNLNTFQCSKTDVERMFQKYGRLAGISMHKGYAFVQFTNPFDARNACLGEDGRTVLSQILDVNMVAEPKPHQTGRKRQNLSKTGNDWDYYYDSYYASTLFAPTPPRPLKRQRLMTNRTSPIPNKIMNTNILPSQPQQCQIQQQQHIIQQSQPIILSSSPTQNGISNCNGMNGDSNTQNHTSSGQQHILGPFKIYSNPDTLICGNCRECFTELSELLDHKKSYCKLRFICKCQNLQLNSTTSNQNNHQNSPTLLCVVCKDPFKNPWDLMVHAQAAHMINIYELGNQNEVTDTEKENQLNGHDSHHNININNNNVSKESGHHIGLDGIEIHGVEINENCDLKDDSSSMRDDQSITSNVHSSNENLLFEEHLTSSPTPSNEEHKQNDEFNTEVCPSEEESCPQGRACIMRTLSIDTTPSAQNVVTSLSMVTNNLGLAISNGSFGSQ